jgi:hypothetical protein
MPITPTGRPKMSYGNPRSHSTTSCWTSTGSPLATSNEALGQALEQSFATARSCGLGSSHPLNKEQSKLDRIGDTHRLQLLMDAIIDYAIYMIDVDGTVRSWNSGAAG